MKRYTKLYLFLVWNKFEIMADEPISLELYFVNSTLSETEIVNIIFAAIREKDKDVSIVINPTLVS